MFARLCAVLLIFAWVDLAALDLLEDLKGISGDGGYAHSNKAYSRGLGRHASLTNNIVESAAGLPADDAPLAQQESFVSELESWPSFQRVVNLHKLHRVYLI